MDSEGQIKHTSSGEKEKYYEEGGEDGNIAAYDDDYYDDDDDDDDDGWQVIALMRTRAIQKWNCTPAVEPSGRLLKISSSY